MTTTLQSPTIAEFMTADPMTVDVGLSVRDAQERMMLNNLRHLVVVQGKRILGVVSSRDLGLALTIPSPNNLELTVADAMTRNPYCCAPETPLAEVARAMEAHRYGCALVRRDNVIVGVFTTVDALRALRAVITGKPAKPESPPTHATAAARERPYVEHHVQTSASLGAGARPSPNQGRIG